MYASENPNTLVWDEAFQRRKPILKNRLDPEVEEALVKIAFEYPGFGQQRVCNELPKRGMFISAGRRTLINGWSTTTTSDHIPEGTVMAKR
ncbi:MAG TPA: hypothetical protein VFP87_03505 [Chitinophagaceae bacterium]|nr:hypothetical protein [Chitinophagaceae bacterium]